jgi:hypothetical protein
VNGAESLVTSLVAGDDTPTRLHRAQARRYQGRQEQVTMALGQESRGWVARWHEGREHPRHL